MKSFIIIVSLLVSTEIQFTLCSGAKDKSAAIHVDESIEDLNEDEPETFDQIGQEDIEHEARRSVQHDEIQKLPDIVPSGNQQKGNNKILTPPDGAKGNKGRIPTSFDEMRKRAIANCDNAINRAKLHLENVQASFETLAKNATMELESATKKKPVQYKKVKSIAAMIERRAMKKLAEAKQRAEKEYQQTKSAAEESYKKAVEESNVALEAADEKFEQVRAQIIENRRKLENTHQPELEKARKEKEIAVSVAKDRLNEAQEKYRKARRSIWKLSAGERKKLENEYQKETDWYDEAVKLADDEWQNVLDNIGIGKQYNEAEEQALKDLEQTQENIKLRLNSLLEKHEKALEEAKMKEDEAIKLAKTEKLKANNERDQIIIEVTKQQQLTLRGAEAKCRRIQTQMKEDLNKATDEFVKAKNEAISEYKKALQTIEEMEKKLTTEANAPKNISNQPFSTPVKSNSGKRENMSSSPSRRGVGDRGDDK